MRDLISSEVWADKFLFKLSSISTLFFFKNFCSHIHGYFFPNNQMKKAPPTNPVTIPMGISSGAIIVRAAISAGMNVL